MNDTIQKFTDSKEIAIAGASPKSSNFGLAIMKELLIGSYAVRPVNPGYEEVEGVKCTNSIAELPVEIENLIITVNPDLAFKIVKEVPESNIKRVWLTQGIGKGAYSEEAVSFMKENSIEYVYGFCPLMFFGSGMHKFHFWLRKNLGKTPSEYSKR